MKNKGNVMDDRLFEEMLNEIDAMTAEEYWSLYREAEKFDDFLPAESGFISIELAGIFAMSSNSNFNNNFYVEAIPFHQISSIKTKIFSDGDLPWLKVA
jgi:hypothetical protein